MHQSTNTTMYWENCKQKLLDSPTERSEVLLQVKDTIIGSNRQKGALISHGLVPVLLDISSKDETAEKLDALIIIGSLARGTKEQVQVLIKEYNVLLVLFKEAILKKNSTKIIEVCLTTMQSIYEHHGAPTEIFYSDTCFITQFLSLASEESSWRTQMCVTSILVSLCRTHDDQIRLLNAGAVHILARMISLENEKIQIPALRCLSRMCYENRSVSDNICVTSYKGRSLPGILNSLMSRLFSPEIQLTAARCLTYIYRCGTLPPTDYRIIHKTVPCLSRLCSDYFDISTRASAAEAFAYLIEINAELQRAAAISNHLFKSLAELLKIGQFTTKQSALKCFASLAANDEFIRKRIVEVPGLLNVILDGLNECNSEVKLASVRCLQSLSRSVQQLRTTFQDHAVWSQFFYLMTSEPVGELLNTVLSTICNLLLEFSPSKESLVSMGVTEKICDFTKSSDVSLRLNSVWALMNMSFQCDPAIKTDIYNCLGKKRLLELLRDNEMLIVLKALGLLRNLLSRTQEVDLIMSESSTQIMDALNSILESNHLPEIKEQTLCVISNIATESSEDYITNNARLMNQIKDFMFNADLQAGALFTIKNILIRKDLCFEQKLARLTQLNIIGNLYELNENRFHGIASGDDFVKKLLKEVLALCQSASPRKKC